MINYFNFKKFKEKFLITNDFGRYAFVDKDTLLSLVNDEIKIDTEIGKQLLSNYFIYSCSPQAFVEDIKFELQDSKNYVFGATALHIFVISNICNMNCVYCQANNGNAVKNAIMDLPTLEKAINIALSSPNHHLTFEIQGGEPLTNFPAVKHLVEYTNSNKGDKKIDFTIVTNLTLLTEDMIDFFAQNSVSVSTSLDGFELLHNHNRPYSNGRSTYNDVVRNIKLLQDNNIKVGAIQTTTRESLCYPQEIIDCYISLGFDNIFIRPLTPLGCAQKQWDKIGYSPEEFISFYHKALNYIIKKNLEGIAFTEGHASIFLSKILHHYPMNYMELRSPCGASIGEMAYYYDGNIFTCDEGRMLYEMGNSSFLLGNVNTHTYLDIVKNPICVATCKASITEALPMCSNCVYQPYCGVCPVISVALYNDVIPKEPNDYKCKIYSGILDTIFELLLDSKSHHILEEWNC